MIKRIVAIGGGLLLVAAGAAWCWGHPRLAWSIGLAGGWLLANGAVIAGLCRAMCAGQPGRRNGWRIGGYGAAKALLYVCAYLAVMRCHPSAEGLAIGVTIGLAALLVGAAQTVQAAHG